MAGFTSFDDLLNEATVNDKLLEWSFAKYTVSTTTPEAAGNWMSLWYEPGSPGAGSDPAATPGTAYDNTAGGMVFPTDRDPDRKLLLAFEGMASQIGTLMLYDRLVGVSGISLASTGNKTINSTTLPRYTTGAGVEAWLELTTATSVTAPILSMNSYTDPVNGSGRAGASITFPAAATNIRWMQKLPLQAGDSGVTAVSTINVGTAASAGVTNLLLIKPLAFIPLSVVGLANLIDMVTGLPDLQRIYDNATLALAWFSAGTAAPNLYGRVIGAYG